MAIYDETVGGAAGYSGHDARGHYVVSVLLDMAEANDGSGLASADAAKVLNIPANTRVVAVRAAVEEAEGGTLTFDVGDSNSATKWHSNLDGNATSTNAIDSTEALYTSADDIRVTADNAADNAKIRIVAEMVDLSPGE